MNVTPFGFAMTLLWSGLLFLALYLCTRSKFVMKKLGPEFLIFMMLAGLFRLLVLGELPFAQVVAVEQYNVINDLTKAEISMDGHPVTVLEILTVVWISGIVVGLGMMVESIYKDFHELRRLPAANDKEVAELVQKVIPEKDRKRIMVLVSDKVTIPYITGLLHGYIILPKAPVMQEDLKAILEHEFIHYKKHHIWLRMAMQGISVILWWNPLVHLFKRAVFDALELSCDGYMVKRKEKSEIISYANSLFRYSGKQFLRRGGAAKFSGDRAIKCRFWVILDSASGEKGNKRMWRLAAAIIVILFLVLSYTVVLQPVYQPVEPEYTEYAVDRKGPNYLIKNEDGTYVLHNRFSGKRDIYIIGGKQNERTGKTGVSEKPYFNGSEVVVDTKYHVPAEEMIIWSLTSYLAPLKDCGYKRYMKLFREYFGEEKYRSLGFPE